MKPKEYSTPEETPQVVTIEDIQKDTDGRYILDSVDNMVRMTRYNNKG